MLNRDPGVRPGRSVFELRTICAGGVYYCRRHRLRGALPRRLLVGFFDDIISVAIYGGARLCGNRSDDLLRVRRHRRGHRMHDDRRNGEVAFVSNRNHIVIVFG